MENGYLIIFSSFYKAAYAMDLLSEVKIKSSIRKAPPELTSSCAYALFLTYRNIDFVEKLLKNYKTAFRGIYAIRKTPGGSLKYEKIL